MGQTESKNYRLRRLLKVQNYAESFTEDGVMYVPTRTITVTAKDPKTPIGYAYLQSEIRRMKMYKSRCHIEPTDKSLTKWAVIFLSEKEMERHLVRWKEAKEAEDTELKPQKLPRRKGKITVSGLSRNDIQNAVEYFQPYVKNPKANYSSWTKMTTITHDGIKGIIKTKMDLGQKPFPKVIKTTQQSRHIVTAVEELEFKCRESSCIVYITNGVIDHKCGGRKCPACEEIY